MRWMAVIVCAAAVWGAGCNLDPDASWFRDADAAATADEDVSGGESDAVSDGETPVDLEVAVTDDADTASGDEDFGTDAVETDESSDTSSDEDAVTEESVIERIQKGKVSVDSKVSFEAVVTAVEYALDSQYQPTGIKGLFVSTPDRPTMLPWNGIYVYLKTPAAVDEYQVGDLLDIAGTYTEYYDASQVQNVTISHLGTTAVPEPALIEDPSRVATPFESNGTEWLPTTNHGPDAEMWESCLIEVHDVEVINQDLGHGQWAVTGGLVIDKKLYYYPGKRTLGTKFERITGILIHIANRGRPMASGSGRLF